MNIRFDYAQAILRLFPNAGFQMAGNDLSTINWESDADDKPSDAEIEQSLIDLQAEYDAQLYARNRATEYPALSEQLDEIYHNGIDSWKAVIKVTKDKYPKG